MNDKPKRRWFQFSLRTVFALMTLVATSAFARGADASTTAGFLDAGVGIVDITPTDSVVLAGSPTRLKSSAVGTRLYVKALVLSAGEQKVAIVTLDTLKYPVEHVVRAHQQVEKTTGILAGNVIICASHTHRGPLWSYYSRPTSASSPASVSAMILQL